MKYEGCSFAVGWRSLAQLIVATLGLAGIIASGGGGGGGASNVAPVADAGADRTVNALNFVALDGSGSNDPDGSIATFRWNQNSGPNVSLISATTESPSFTAPNVAVDSVLIFSLTVTDNAGAADSASVSITVKPRGTFTLSGNISVTAAVAVDSDTNDPLAPFTSNDMPNEAQDISNPITLGGYLNVPGAGETGRSQANGDLNDYYRVDLLAGQKITMVISDFQTGDADLYLHNSTGQSIVDSSVGVGQIESIDVPADGQYLINPRARSGASNYVLVIGNTGITSASGGMRSSGDFVPGQVIVRYKSDAVTRQSFPPGSMISRTNDQAHFRVRAGAPSRPMLLEMEHDPASIAAMTGGEGSGEARNMSFLNPADRAKWNTLMAIKALQEDPEVAWAEPNYIVRPTRIPNDEAYFAQWHFPLINLPAAWDLTIGDNAIVAVIDTGVLLNHPDLQGQIIPGYDFIDDIATAGDGNSIDSNPDDPGDGGDGTSSFHGTHVAGTVAASSNNGIGVAGVAWNAKIMPLRALGIGGGTSYDVGQAMLYAARLPNDSGTVPAQKADVINLSLGGPFFSQDAQDIVTAVRQAGVIVVAAAGNESSSAPFYPASYNGVVSVSAVDSERLLAPYSSFGTGIDVAAPGGDVRFDRDADGFADGVLSTGGEDQSGPISFTYLFSNGTSMASPHVAGVFALMKAANPNLTPASIDQQLTLGTLTDDLGSAGRDNSFGYGLINAQKAVTVALTLAGMPPPDNPLLGVTPGSLNFDSATAAIDISLQNVSTGSLQLNSITPSEPWLTVAPVSVDGSNLGTYRVTVNRSGLADGIYAGEISALSDINTVIISVVMSVGGAGGDVGFIYLLLIDAESGDAIEVKTPSVSNGIYSFSFSNVAAGTYGLVAGTDADNDFVLCDSGEACGAYLTIDQPIAFDVTGSRSGLNFPIGYVVALPAVSLGDDPASIAVQDRSIETSRVIKRRLKEVAR